MNSNSAKIISNPDIDLGTLGSGERFISSNGWVGCLDATTTKKGENWIR